MQTIKFSHKYAKMPDDMSLTYLIEVLRANYKTLHGAFINYDTEYNNGWYSLPKGELIILLFYSYVPIKENPEHYSLVLWTTVRRWTPEKEVYYRALRGQQVKIEIKEELK